MIPMGNNTKIINIKKLSHKNLALLNGLVICGSVLICALLVPTRWPGMELANIAPNWLMMWVVAWSIKRSVWQGVVAGIAVGALQDGLSGSHVPSHIVSLVIVGVLTALLRKQRYIQEELASTAIITFFMSGIAETITALQYIAQTHSGLAEISQSAVWLRYQQVALASGILSSLWMPVLYYPLNRWWETVESVDD
jgi:rod shape-determining protein MreD